MTLSIMTLSIMTTSITKLCQYAECHCAECCDLFIGMLNVVRLNVVRLNVIMLSVMARLYLDNTIHCISRWCQLKEKSTWESSSIEWICCAIFFRVKCSSLLWVIGNYKPGKSYYSVDSSLNSIHKEISDICTNDQV